MAMVPLWIVIFLALAAALPKAYRYGDRKETLARPSLPRSSSALQFWRPPLKFPSFKNKLQKMALQRQQSASSGTGILTSSRWPIRYEHYPQRGHQNVLLIPASSLGGIIMPNGQTVPGRRPLIIAGESFQINPSRRSEISQVRGRPYRRKSTRRNPPIKCIKPAIRRVVSTPLVVPVATLEKHVHFSTEADVSPGPELTISHGGSIVLNKDLEQTGKIDKVEHVLHHIAAPLEELAVVKLPSEHEQSLSDNPEPELTISHGGSIVLNKDLEKIGEIDKVENVLHHIAAPLEKELAVVKLPNEHEQSLSDVVGLGVAGAVSLVEETASKAAGVLDAAEDAKEVLLKKDSVVVAPEPAIVHLVQESPEKQVLAMTGLEPEMSIAEDVSELKGFSPSETNEESISLIKGTTDELHKPEDAPSDDKTVSVLQESPLSLAGASDDATVVKLLSSDESLTQGEQENLEQGTQVVAPEPLQSEEVAVLQNKPSPVQLLAGYELEEVALPDDQPEFVLVSQSQPPAPEPLQSEEQLVVLQSESSPAQLLAEYELEEVVLSEEQPELVLISQSQPVIFVPRERDEELEFIDFSASDSDVPSFDEHDQITFADHTTDEVVSDLHSGLAATDNVETGTTDAHEQETLLQSEKEVILEAEPADLAETTHVAVELETV